MTKSEALKERLTQTDLETIQELAEQNQAPRDIALALGVSKAVFMHIWRDKKSQVREYYERGRFEIERKKEQALIDRIERDGKITAIQIHDKKSEARRFEDIKEDIFGFNSL